MSCSQILPGLERLRHSKSIFRQVSGPSFKKSERTVNKLLKPMLQKDWYSLSMNARIFSPTYLLYLCWRNYLQVTFLSPACLMLTSLSHIPLKKFWRSKSSAIPKLLKPLRMGFFLLELPPGVWLFFDQFQTANCSLLQKLNRLLTTPSGFVRHCRSMVRRWSSVIYFWMFNPWAMTDHFFILGCFYEFLFGDFKDMLRGIEEFM